MCVALEALVQSLRGHVNRLSSSLSSHSNAITSLRAFQTAAQSLWDDVGTVKGDVRAWKEDVDALRMGMEGLGDEVAEVRDLIEGLLHSKGEHVRPASRMTATRKHHARVETDVETDIDGGDEREAGRKRRSAGVPPASVFHGPTKRSKSRSQKAQGVERWRGSLKSDSEASVKSFIEVRRSSLLPFLFVLTKRRSLMSLIASGPTSLTKKLGGRIALGQIAITRKDTLRLRGIVTTWVGKAPGPHLREALRRNAGRFPTSSSGRKKSLPPCLEAGTTTSSALNAGSGRNEHRPPCTSARASITASTTGRRPACRGRKRGAKSKGKACRRRRSWRGYWASSKPTLSITERE